MSLLKHKEAVCLEVANDCVFTYLSSWAHPIVYFPHRVCNKSKARAKLQQCLKLRVKPLSGPCTHILASCRGKVLCVSMYSFIQLSGRPGPCQSRFDSHYRHDLSPWSKVQDPTLPRETSWFCVVLRILPDTKCRKGRKSLLHLRKANSSVLSYRFQHNLGQPHSLDGDEVQTKDSFPEGNCRYPLERETSPPAVFLRHSGNSHCTQDRTRERFLSMFIVFSRPSRDWVLTAIRTGMSRPESHFLELCERVLSISFASWVKKLSVCGTKKTLKRKFKNHALVSPLVLGGFFLSVVMSMTWSHWTPFNGQWMQIGIIHVHMVLCVS